MINCHWRMVILALVWKGHLQRGQDGARKRNLRKVCKTPASESSWVLEIWIPGLHPASNKLLLLQTLPQSMQFYHAAQMLLKDWDLLLKYDCYQLCMLESRRKLIKYPDDWLYNLDQLNQHFWRWILGFGVFCFMCFVFQCSPVIGTFSKGWHPLSRKCVAVGLWSFAYTYANRNEEGMGIKGIWKIISKVIPPSVHKILLLDVLSRIYSLFLKLQRCIFF